MTRKKILFICSASTIAVTLCATVTGVTLVQKNKMHTKDSPDQKPSNFEKWNIHDKITSSELQEFVKVNIENNRYDYSIIQTDFCYKIKSSIRKALSNEDRFKSHASEYVIYIDYLFLNAKTVDVESIWTLTTADYHNNNTDNFFYDKFEMFLHN